MNEITFYEQQQFRQKWMYIIYFLLIGLLGLFIYADIQQIFLGKAFGSKPASNFTLFIVTLFITALLILLYLTKMETTINRNGIFYRWTPFMKKYKKINWENISQAKIINCGFVGYGWRLTPFGTVFSVGGDTGLQLILNTGKKIVLGTQKANELSDILKLLQHE